jgi:hypothetical protein
MMQIAVVARVGGALASRACQRGLSVVCRIGTPLDSFVAQILCN